MFGLRDEGVDRALARAPVAVAALDQTEADYAAFAQAPDVQRIAEGLASSPVRRASLLPDT